MKIKTFYTVLLLLLAINFSSCKSSSDSGVMTADEVTAQLEKKNKKQAKANKKLKKEAYKAYWSNQTKEARKSIRRNNRRAKRLARHRKKGGR
ncbi:MAG: hypothetical protein AB8B56_13580 [Crocinitomicaceae bacterium]